MEVKYQTYKVKSILNTHKYLDGGWFWTKYSAYPYLGCQFGCQYCFYRDRHYCPYKNLEDFDKLIKAKENAPELLKKELSRIKDKEYIAVGDWQPAELKYRLSRQMLKVCLNLGFPVFILEKSPLVLQDLELLKKINKKAGTIVGFSIITTKDDRVRKIFEPQAPLVRARFEAMRKIARMGILTGTVLMPILPFIYDNDNNLEAVIKKTKGFGGKFVLGASLTLQGELKPYYYGILAQHFPDLIEKYDIIVKNNDSFSEYYQPIALKIKKYCQKYKIPDYIPRPLQHYPPKLHLNKKMAEKFYLKAKDYQGQPKNRYREWAYRRAARAVDDLEESLADIYKHTWLVGLQRIPGIGNRLAHEIERELKNYNLV